MSRIAVLAYSGGLDTSCAIAWLKEDYGFDEVVAVLVDVGQEAEFEPAIARGYAAGATDVVLVDRKQEFASEQVAKALLANALYEGRYPLVSSLSGAVCVSEAVLVSSVVLSSRSPVARLDPRRRRSSFSGKVMSVIVALSSLILSPVIDSTRSVTLRRTSSTVWRMFLLYSMPILRSMAASVLPTSTEMPLVLLSEPVMLPSTPLVALEPLPPM